MLSGSVTPLLITPNTISLPIWAVCVIASVCVACVGSALFVYLRSRSRSRRIAILLSEAQESSRVRSDFLANMSHEIRTPLNGILGLVELALGTELNVIQRDFLTSVNESAASLLAMVNQILDCSRIEAGKMKLDRVEFDIHRLITEAVRAFAYQAHEKNLELLYFVSPEVPERVEGDPTRLRQVLVNLLGNALKFTHRGEVELRCEVSCSEADEFHLRFSVRDTGIGIPKSKQKDIFAAFTQADSSINREFGGTGLGLTISAQLAQLMGGAIHVKSQQGEGSTFFFSVQLWRSSTSIETSSELANTRKMLGGKRMLVVDDNSTNLGNLEGMLKGNDILVSKARSAEMARQMLEAARRGKQSFDAVIVDSDMPDVDSFALVSDLLKGDHDASKPAIMMLTSKNLNEHVERCRALGITFLLKPVSSERLMQVVSDLVTVRQRRMIAEASAPPWRTPTPEGPALHILLAEDNIVNQKIVLEMLKKTNCQVQAVANGAEAVASWKHQSYDLILMDMQMPRMDGTEAAAKIREAEKSGRTRIPILALTANASEQDRLRCLSAGMDDYLSKPFKSEQLLAKVYSLAGAPKVA